ncbi:MAG: metallophosphoesterase family protein [Marinilabiliales bacterium]
MTKIGLLSDTHGHIDDKLFEFFNDVDEIWHAGDIGSYEVYSVLSEFKKFRGVYGNIDDYLIRGELDEDIRFMCEGMDVWIRHIGGYPGKYDWSIREKIEKNPPDLFICGHSHILKVMNDKTLKLLHINPGAYGKSGLHYVRTAVKFEIHDNKVSNLNILEIKRK